MSTLLDALYKEHNELKEKLDKVADLILSYGGKIPHIEDTPPKINVPNKALNELLGYPVKGTWKDKIMFALSEFDEPVTAKIISQVILREELKLPDEERGNAQHIANMVTQYTSTMGKAGEIGVDNSEFRNKYFMLKS